jgi:hypothetical protein
MRPPAREEADVRRPRVHGAQSHAH